MFSLQEEAVYCSRTTLDLDKIDSSKMWLQISVDNIVVRAICKLPNMTCVEIPDCYSITNSALPDLGQMQGTDLVPFFICLPSKPDCTLLFFGRNAVCKRQPERRKERPRIFSDLMLV